jgi:hypothetical protein
MDNSAGTLGVGSTGSLLQATNITAAANDASINLRFFIVALF